MNTRFENSSKPTEDMGEAIRIVVLGNDGVGKSSLANSIFGEDVFSVNDSPNSQNKDSQSKCKNINGKDVQLVEFPGLFKSNPRSTELSPELLKCFTECAPGPHAFLLVLKVGRFTHHDKAVVDIILSYFTEDALKYTTVVFTHGEDLPNGMEIEDWVKQNEALKNLVQKCDDRCHAIDNKHCNKQERVKQLLETINAMMREKKSCYTNEMLTKIHRDIEKEKESIRHKQIDKLFMDIDKWVLKNSSFTNEMRENVHRNIQKEKTLMREKPLENLPSMVDGMFQSLNTELMKNKDRYTNENLTKILRDIQKEKESVLLMVEETLTHAALQVMAEMAVHGSLILSLGCAVLGVLLGAFLGVAEMLAAVAITSLSLLQFIPRLLTITVGILAGGFISELLAEGLVAGLKTGLATGSVLGLWAGGLIWMQSFLCARDAEIHLRNLDELYQKLL